MKRQIIILVTCIFSMLSLSACKKEGCTDPNAKNYKKKAKSDDGSCSYDIITLTGSQNADLTLNKTTNLTNGTDYFVDGTWEINAGVTIEPGVVIEMKNNSRIIVSGAGYLNASGTSDKKIVFKGSQNTKGYWNEIRFVSNNNNNVLNHVIIDNGGGDTNWDAAVYGYESGRVKISNTEIKNSLTYGFRIWNKEFLLDQFSNVTISNCQKGALNVKANHMGAFDNTTIFSGNGKNYFEIGHENIVSNIVVKKTNHPYYIYESFDIGANLTIQPGVTFLMGSNTYLYVKSGGSLNAVGTATDKITFTGEQQTKGYWNGIRFTDSNNSLNNFQYTEVSYGGGDASWDGAIYLYYDSYFKLGNSTISNSQRWGIVNYANLTNTFVNDGNNTFNGNELGDINE